MVPDLSFDRVSYFLLSLGVPWHHVWHVAAPLCLVRCFSISNMGHKHVRHMLGGLDRRDILKCEYVPILEASCGTTTTNSASPITMQ